MNFPSFDTELLLYINQCNNVLMDTVMLKFSDTWTWSLLLLVVVFVVLRNRPLKETLLIILGIALCVLVADQISSSLIKPWVARFRPTHDPDLMFEIRHIAGRAGQYGFVSSHAANTFAVATFMSLVFRHRLTTLCLFAWAFVVGYSRIYLGVHFPLDVFCGGMLGIVVGYLVYILLRFATIRLMPSTQQYYSTAYTRSGFLRDDMHILLTVMALTLVYTLF
ncbi:MAG: phosphatase PAP2 family protein [Bacteroidaceae bacterium]|nr:phosphatase PAP2 family protein [Bacteroidaceae bacterium]